MMQRMHIVHFIGLFIGWGLLTAVDAFCLGGARDPSSPNSSVRATSVSPSGQSGHGDAGDFLNNSSGDDSNLPPLVTAEPQPPSSTTKIRLNKVFKATHSRRQADALIASGHRVTINGNPVTTKGGEWVTPFVDQVTLDGKLVQGWEALNGISAASEIGATTTTRAVAHEYIKYWKPRGVTCTTDRRVAGNILDALEQATQYHHGTTTKTASRRIPVEPYAPRHRVFPVGRLDKDTSGLILVTSDGCLPNALLRAKEKRSKVYHVWVDRPLADADVERLRTGVVITTVAQRDRKTKPITAPTQPCHVERAPRNPRAVRMTLTEGRNRQIRKMMAALGYTVVRLHRVEFGGIVLAPLAGPGEWQHLTDTELQQILPRQEDGH